jgi:mannose-6-phosphate isomerase-like protein (cupin superfamily)
MRRVVTTIGPDGRSTILSDDEPGTHRWGHALWPRSSDDPPLLELVAGEVVWRSYEVTSTEDMDVYVRDKYPAAADEPPGMHATPTKDFLLVLSGVLELVLDDATVRLGAGDIVVQQATRHAWRFIKTPVRYAVLSIGVAPRDPTADCLTTHGPDK